MPKRDPEHVELFLSHRSMLVDYAAPIVGCRSRAEDVVQEAFIRFSAAMGGAVGGGAADGGPTNHDPVAHPLSYLRRIVRNLALDWVRSPARRHARLDEETSRRMPAEARTPEDTSLYRDELRVLAEALRELPERTRTAFLMHRVEGRTLHEVALRLGVSTVRAHQLVKDAILHAADRLDDRLD